MNTIFNDINTNDLHAVVKALKEWKQLQKQCEENVKELENLVKSEMKTQDKPKMFVGEYTCTLSTVTQNRIDTKALQAEEPEIYRTFLKPSTYERLTVK